MLLFWFELRQKIISLYSSTVTKGNMSMSARELDFGYKHVDLRILVRELFLNYLELLMSRIMGNQVYIFLLVSVLYLLQVFTVVYDYSETYNQRNKTERTSTNSIVIDLLYFRHIAFVRVISPLGRYLQFSVRTQLTFEFCFLGCHRQNIYNSSFIFLKTRAFFSALSIRMLISFQSN